MPLSHPGNFSRFRDCGRRAAVAVDGEEGPLEAGVNAAIPDAVGLSLPLSLGTVAGRQY